MREKALRLLGLMRRANALAPGEQNTGSAVRSGKAALLLLASDASANARKRAEGFAAARQLPLTELPFTKEEFACAVGGSVAAIAAVTDAGFAGALLRALAALDAARYGEEAAAWESRGTALRKRPQKKRNVMGGRTHEHDQVPRT